MSKQMTESQIVAVLKEADTGIAVKNLCRKRLQISISGHNNYGGVEISDFIRLNEENRRIKPQDIGI